MLETETQKTSIILHGHFYQPPRENPNTGVIPLQPSAAPWADWNERIYDQCYGANLHSRYLDSNGKIINISNNYSYISFNFGPTLLSWLDKVHPEAIEGLREADKESILRLGHGNAIPQGFNHTILPLDKEENAKLQIDWAIKDFHYHFHRAPEGMWLPECGVNETVVQLLHDAGIKFIILSPWQGAAVEDNYGKMIDLGSNPAPFKEPYLITGKNGGDITAFFYEPGLASGISFGHFLQSADNLYSTLLNIRNSTRTPLIHTATDGEIYGHHEPYGDMALAALIQKVNERNDFILDNYGSYMEKHPATKHALLRSGEEGKGSSWSCSHGVSRWYKNCGCHTGGEAHWNQKWRTGLRNALNNLAEKIEATFAKEVSLIFEGKLSPEQLLMDAGNVFCEAEEMQHFIDTLQNKYEFSEEKRVILAHLLTGMMYKHFSFTSCGWFFSELSGIEPRQNIKYAMHAISLFQQFTDEELMIPFLEDLSKAKSNIKECGNGMDIAQEELKGIPGEVESALYFYMNRSVGDESIWKKQYGRFVLDSYKNSNQEYGIVVQDISTEEKFTFRFLPATSIEKGINIYITKVTAPGIKPENYHITNESVPERISYEVYSWLDSAMAAIDNKTLIEMTDQVRLYAMLLKQNPVHMNERLLENLGVALRLIRSLMLSRPNMKNTMKRADIIKELAIFVYEYGRTEEKTALSVIIDNVIVTIGMMIKRDGLTEDSANIILKALVSIRELGREPELKELQNIIYLYYINKKKAECSPALADSVYSALNFK